MTSREIICIMCPIGCRMSVQLTDKKKVQVEGNQCKKGSKHAQQELTFPGRVLTTTVRTANPAYPLLPIRSSKQIPRDRLDDCMREIARLQVRPPVQSGGAVIKDILGIGVDMVACASLC
ncbi:DUF1667 domain-containing protein [Chloroflexota bacterium]